MAESKLSAEEINELKKLIRELGWEMSSLEFDNLLKSGAGARSLLSSLRKEASAINKEITDLTKSINDVVKGLKQSESGAFQTAKSFREIDNLGDRILNHQKGYNELSSDEADLLAVKLKYEKLRLGDLQKHFAEERKFLEEKKKDFENDVDKTEEINKLIKENEESHKEINKLLDEKNDKYETLVGYAKQIAKEQENLERALGVTGAAIDGIGKGFERIGLGALADRIGLDKAKNRMKEFTHYITDGGKKSAGLVGQFRILGVGIGSLGQSIMKNLTDPLVLAGLAAKGVSAGVGLIKKGFSLLKGGVSSVVGFVKNLWSMADSFAAVFEKYAKAGQFAAQNFSAIGGQVNKIGSGLKAAAAADPFMRVAEAGPALKTIVDGTGMFTTSMLKSVKSAHDLSYWLGYSAEETGELARLGAMQGKDAKVVLEDIKTQGTLLKGQYKSAVDLRKVEQTALKASASVTYYLKQNPKALAEAAFHATRLGMTLDEINSAASATLDFESSISGQLAYQAISGKELNIDAYQQAKLNKDAVGMARELNNLVKLHQKDLETSVFAQEEFAKVTGISVEKQNEAMQTMQLQNRLSAEAEDIERGIQYLMKEKNLSREKAAEKLSKQDITNSLAASKRAEAMSRALEDFRDYMATRLWPLFKAVFSPANIKMFMAVIGGMRPVFVELGKAITAFFSPKSAGAMTDVIKKDVMPTILSLAKMLTQVAGGAGETLFSVIKALGPTIKDDVIPIVMFLADIIKSIAPEVGVLVKALVGGVSGVLGKVNDNKEEIRDFIVTLASKVKGILDFVGGNIKEIAIAIAALKGFSILKSSGIFDMVKMAAGVARLGRGSNPVTPMFTKDVAGMGMVDKLKNLFSLGLAGNSTKAAASTVTAATTATPAATNIASEAVERGSSPMNPLFVKEVGKMAGGAPGAATKAGAAPLAATASKASTLPAGMKYDKAGRLQYEKGNELGKKGFVSKADAEKLGVSRTATAGGAAAPLTQTAAPKSFADKRKMVAERKAAGGGLGSKAASNVDDGAAKSGSKLAKFGGGLDKAGTGMLKGAAALVVLAGALFIAAKAFQEFSEVIWTDVLLGLTVLGALVFAVKQLGKIEKDVIKGAGAVAILSGALYIAAKAFQEFGEVDFPSVLAGAATMGLFALAVYGLSKVEKDLIKGAAAIGILSVSLYVAAKALQEFSNVGVDGIIKAGVTLVGLTLSLKLIAKSKADLIKAGAALLMISASLYIAAKGIQEFSKVEPEDMLKAAGALLALGGSLVGLSRLMGKQAKNLIIAGAAMVLMAGSLFILAKALQEFATVEPEDMLKAAGALLALGGAVVGLSRLMGKQAPLLIAAGAAMVLMAGSLLILAIAIKQFENIELETMGKAGLALLGLTAAVAGLGAVMASGLGAIAIMLGVAAMLAMGAALYVVAKALQVMQEVVGGNKLETLGDDLSKGLTSVTTELEKVDFSTLTDKFAALENAFKKLNIDRLLAFSQLAKGDLGKAATNLVEGMKNLTQLNSPTGQNSSNIDFTKFTEDLVARLKPLEGVNTAFSTALRRLNVDQLVKLSQVSGEGIKKAMTGLMDTIKYIATFDFGMVIDENFNPDDLESKLGDFIWVFQNFNTAISRINFDKLKQFASTGKLEISLAATNLITGINTMAGITTPVQEIGDNVKTAFTAFNRLLSTLNMDAFSAFAKLAETDISLAMTKFVTSLEHLGSNVDEKTFANAQHIEAAVNNFNKIIGSIKIEPGPIGGVGSDGLLAFAKLADVNLSLAVENLKLGLAKMQEKLGEFEELGKADYSAISTVFTKLNGIVGDANLDNFAKLGSLAEANLGDAAEKIKLGLNAFKLQFGNDKITDYDYLDTVVKPIFEKIAAVFAPDASAGKAITTLEQFAKADFSKFATAIVDFKNGIINLKVLENIYSEIDLSDDGVIATFFEDLSKIFNPHGSVLNLDNLIKFGTTDFTKFKASIKGLKDGLLELQGLPDQLSTTTKDLATGTETKVKFDPQPLTEIINAIAGIFSGPNVEKFTAFAGEDFSKLPNNASKLTEGIEAIAKIPTGNKDKFTTLQQEFSAVSLAISSLNISGLGEFAKAASMFKILQTALTNLKNALNVLTGLKVAAEIAQLKELASIDSSKLITLSEAVIKLSDSFVILAKALNDMGDITKVVTISEQMLKLHESISKNPMDAEKLAEGVGGIFSGLMGSLVSFVEGGGQKVADKFKFGATGEPIKDGVIKMNDGVKVGGNTTLFGKGQIQQIIDKTGKLIILDKADYLTASTNKPETAEIMPAPIPQSESLNIKPQIIQSINNNEVVVAAINRLIEATVAKESPTPSVTVNVDPITGTSVLKMARKEGVSFG